MNLEIEHSQTNETTHIVKLTGEVDTYTAPKLKKELIPVTERQEGETIIDLSNIEYMDSTGLGVIIAGLKSAQKNNNLLQVTGLTSRVERLFEITGLLELLEKEQRIKGGTK